MHICLYVCQKNNGVGKRANSTKTGLLLFAVHLSTSLNEFQLRLYCLSGTVLRIP